MSDWFGEKRKFAFLSLLGLFFHSAELLGAGDRDAVEGSCRRQAIGKRIGFSECVYNRTRGEPGVGIDILLDDNKRLEGLDSWRLVYVGRLLLRDEEMELAKEAFDLACAGLDLVEDAVGQIECRTGRIDYFLATEAAKSVLAELTEIESIARSSESSPALALFLEEEADLHIKKSNFGAARRSLSEIARLPATKGESFCQRKCWFLRGRAAMALGRYQEAVLFYGKTVDSLIEAGDLRNLAVVKSNIEIAKTHWMSLRAADIEAAREQQIEAFTRLLGIAEEAQKHVIVMRALFNRGKLTRGQASDRDLAECVRLADRYEEESFRIDCRQARALRLATIHPQRARAQLAEASELLMPLWGQPAALFHSSDALAVTWLLFPEEFSRESSLAWLRTIELVTEMNVSSQSQVQFFSAWSDTHSAVVGNILRAKSSSDESLREVFELQERMRARELGQGLARNEVSPTLLPLQSELLKRRNSLDESIVGHNQQLLDPGLPDALRTGLDASLVQLELERDAVDEEIVRQHPERAKVSAVRASIHEVSAALGPSEALLSYQLSPTEDIYGDFAGGSWILVLTRDGTQVVDLGDGRPLARSAEDFLAQFGQRRGHRRRAIQGDRKLYDDLVAPALAVLPPGVDRLVVVPDGVLHLLPFGALRDPQDQLLAERFVLSVAPSASLWLRWRNMPRPETDGMALVLADPVTPSTSATAASGTVLRGVHDEAGKLPPLPAARREGEAVVGHLHGGSRLLTGHEASERALKETDLSDYRVLHVAAHAIVEEENPDRSAVFLAPGADNEDGLLQIREIVDLDLEGRMVVLSACSSARGTVLRGEGVMSLARAFFAAGAPAVIGSLWPVADEPARQLFDAFYRHLARGASVADALRSAQLERIAAGASVEDWASVEVFGDGAYVPFPRSFSRRYLSVAGAAIVGLMLATWLVRRRAG